MGYAEKDDDEEEEVEMQQNAPLINQQQNQMQ
jgi:hypothetical protein